MCSQCKPQANHRLSVFVCRVARTPSCCPALAAHSAQSGHQLLPRCKARDCGVQAEAMAQPPVTETHGTKRKVEVSICLGFAPLVIHHGAEGGTSPAVHHCSHAVAASGMNKPIMSWEKSAFCTSCSHGSPKAHVWPQHPQSTGTVCPVLNLASSLQTPTALGELGQLNCLVKYKWAGDFLKLEECGKPLWGG